MTYLLHVKGTRVGPLTECQVLEKYDAGEIDGLTKIAPSDEPDQLASPDCGTLEQSNLFDQFEGLRALKHRPANYYLQRILENQTRIASAQEALSETIALQTTLLRSIKWGIVALCLFIVVIPILIGGCQAVTSH